MIVSAYITPHPPILIPKIGRENLERVQETIFALENLAEKLYQAKPETILVISPHGPITQDKFCILGKEKLYGNFSQFGDIEDEFNYKNNLELVKEIEKESKKEKIPLSLINENWLDHGMLVPLYHLTSGKLDNIPILGMGFSMLDLQTHFNLGKVIYSVTKNKKVAIIASGDLSHRLTPDAPAGYSEKGKEFDKKLIELLKKNDSKGILNLDSNLIEEAGECGLRSIIILLGILDKVKNKTEILSYQAPFGVGYLVVDFKILDKKQI